MLWGPSIKSSILHPELCMRNSVQLLITCMNLTFITLGFSLLAFQDRLFSLCSCPLQLFLHGSWCEV